MFDVVNAPKGCNVSIEWTHQSNAGYSENTEQRRANNITAERNRDGTEIDSEKITDML